MSLLPARDTGGAGPVAEPLRVLDELALPDARFVLVVADAADRLYAVPSRQAGGPPPVRAVPGDGVAEALVELLHRGGPARVGAFEVVRWHGTPGAGEEAVRVDQTNESVVVGGVAVVKWVVRASTDPHPAPHRFAVLAAAGFTGMPRPWGLLLWHDPRRPDAAPPVLLATVSAYVPSATDGWEWAVEDVRTVARGETSSPEDVAPATELGTLSARMHVALATDGVRPAAEAEAVEWHRRATADLDDAVAGVDGAEGARLAALAGRARSALAPMADAAGSPVLAVHGDLHVGQVLRTREPVTYLVTDFDGNPVLGAADRLAPMPAALDVAGMLQSLDHVGRVVLHRTPGVDRAAVTGWIPRAQEAFLAAYREGLAADGRADLLDSRLLGAFRVQQECREFRYALAHLPHWRYVPDAALPALLDELSSAVG